MSPAKIRYKIVSDRIMLIRDMIAKIRALPLETFDVYNLDPRNAASAESFLRRSLESLMDIGRHILAKGFAIAVGEYKMIATRLHECGVIDGTIEKIFSKLAGYRNRMVHFYDEITDDELYEICTKKLIDIESVLDTLTRWLKEHPEKIDTSL